jgi:hypothetical protein
MKSLRVAILAAAAMIAGVMAQAQTAEEIVNKHIEAIGGKEKIQGIKSVYTEYDMDVMGNQAPGVTWLLTGKGYRNEIDFGGQKIIQCVTDKGGWGINPMMGQTSPEPLPEDQVKMQRGSLNPGGPLVEFKEKGHKIELNGTENVNGVAAHKIKLNITDGPEVIYLIDPNTFYILKSIMKSNQQGQEVETSFVFSDYKKTDYGFVQPGTTEMTLPGFTLNIKLKKIEINKEIDPKIFEMQ